MLPPISSAQKHGAVLLHRDRRVRSAAIVHTSDYRAANVSCVLPLPTPEDGSCGDGESSSPVCPRDEDELEFCDQGRRRGLNTKLEAILAKEIVQGHNKNRTADVQPLVFESMNIMEQYDAIRNAKLVIAPEGATAVWSMFSPENSTWVVVYDHDINETARSNFEEHRYMFAMRHVYFHIPLFRIMPWTRLIIYEVYTGCYPPLTKLRQALDVQPWRTGITVVQCDHAPKYPEEHLRFLV